MHAGGAAEWTFRFEPAHDAETIRARMHPRSFPLQQTENCGPQSGDPVWLALRWGLTVEKDFEREVANAFGRERNAAGVRRLPLEDGPVRRFWCFRPRRRAYAQRS
jgi:hypothetical protein